MSARLSSSRSLFRATATRAPSPSIDGSVPAQESAEWICYTLMKSDSRLSGRRRECGEEVQVQQSLGWKHGASRRSPDHTLIPSCCGLRAAACANRSSPGLAAMFAAGCSLQLAAPGRLEIRARPPRAASRVVCTIQQPPHTDNEASTSSSGKLPNSKRQWHPSTTSIHAGECAFFSPGSRPV